MPTQAATAFAPTAVAGLFCRCGSGVLKRLRNRLKNNALQKAVFYAAKGGLSGRKSIPFRMQKGTFWKTAGVGILDRPAEHRAQTA